MNYTNTIRSSFIAGAHRVGSIMSLRKRATWKTRFIAGFQLGLGFIAACAVVSIPVYGIFLYAIARMTNIAQ